MKQWHADLMSPCNRVAAFAPEWHDDRQRELQTTGRGTCALLVRFRRSLPVRLVGGLGDHCNERFKLQVAQTKLTELADLGFTLPTPLFAGEPESSR